MKEITHDPEECIKNIFSILINNKKRIGFLFGAGTSQAKKDKDKSIVVPAIKELTEIVEKKILEEKNSDGKEIYTEVIDALKSDLKDKYNIETILSNIEQKHEIIGSIMINGLNKEGYKILILKIKEIIKSNMSVHVNKEINYDSLIQSDFANWIGQAEREFGIEIFTTNYDYLFELGFEYHNIPYYDGFSGSYRPFFNSDSVENFNYLLTQTKLWKIHGSLGWHNDDVSGRTLRYETDNNDIFIFPSIFKYKNSKKQPYISLLDRMSNFIKSDDSVLFTCGYSFGDEHINERIITSLNCDKNSHVIALYYDEYFEGKNKKYSLNTDSNIFKLAQKSNGKLSVLGMRSAVIGRQIGKWKLNREPDKEYTLNINQYFDEDASESNVELNKESKGTEIYSGEGVFILPDFKNFVSFLNSMIAENPLSNFKK